MRGWGRGRTEQLSGGGAGLGSEVGRRRATEVWVRLLQAVGGTGPSPRVPVAPRGRGSGDWTSGDTAGMATTWAPRVSPAHRPWGAHLLGTRAGAGPRPTTIFSWPQASNTRGDNGGGAVKQPHFCTRTGGPLRSRLTPLAVARALSCHKLVQGFPRASRAGRLTALQPAGPSSETQTLLATVLQCSCGSTGGGY